MPPEVERRLLRQAQQTFRATPIYGLPETCTNEDLLIAWPLLPLLEHPKDEEARAALRKLLEHARTTLTALKEIHPDDDDIADLHRGLLKYQEARIDMLVAGLKDDASVKNIMVIEFSTVAKRHGQFMEAVQEYLQRHRLRMR
jgi:hypothetical protein